MDLLELLGLLRIVDCAVLLDDLLLGHQPLEDLLELEQLLQHDQHGGRQLLVEELRRDEAGLHGHLQLLDNLLLDQLLLNGLHGADGRPLGRSHLLLGHLLLLEQLLLQ